MADMKNRPMNDLLPQRKITGETPALTPRPMPTPPAPQPEPVKKNPVVAKGDGMTSDKPALPSEQRPDAGKLARTPSNPGTPATIETKADVPAQQISAAIKAAASNPNSIALQRRKGGYGKGDGMTAPKPRLADGLPSPTPVSLPAQPGATMSLNELLRRNSNPKQPAVPERPGPGQGKDPKDPIDQVDVGMKPLPLPGTIGGLLPKKPKKPKGIIGSIPGIPDPNIPSIPGIPGDKGTVGEILKRKGLAGGLQPIDEIPIPEKADGRATKAEAFKLSLEREAAQKRTDDGELHSSLEDPDYDKAPLQIALKSQALPAVLKTTGAPADAPEIPPHLLPIEDAASFKADFQKALQDEEPWAKDLLTYGEDQRAKLEAAHAEDEEPDRPMDDVPERPRAAERPGRPDPVKMAMDKARKENTPWVLALDAAEEASRAAAQQAEMERVLKTDFDTSAPETLSPADQKAVKDHNKDPRIPHPTAEDGSLKVPEPKEKFVKEYVRTNAQVELMQMGGQANLYNPLYAHHLTQTIGAAGRDDGAPPDGKGFLAMTEHGFAYVYDDSKSADVNRMRAEFSLKTGVSFDQLEDLKVPDALKEFESFDPTKKGETKLRIEDSKHGWHKMSLKSDGNGNVTTTQYFHPNRTEHWKDQIERYGLEVVALAASVVSGGSTFALYASTAVAVKGVYQGIKNGDWLGAALSAAGGFAALGAAGKLGTGAVARAAATVGHVADAVSAIQKTVASVKAGSISGVITGLGSAAGALASTGAFPKDVASAFENIKNLSEKYGPLVAMGESAYALYKKGDYVGAFADAVGYAAKHFGTDMGLSKETAEQIARDAAVIKKVDTAVRNKDYAGAISELLSGIRGEIDPQHQNKLLGAGVAVSGIVSKLQNSDPAGAAKLAAEFGKELLASRQKAEERVKDPSCPPEEKHGLQRFIDDVNRQVQRMGGYEELGKKVNGIMDAINKKDVAGLVKNVSSLLESVTGKEGFGVAANLADAARKAVDAVKSHDFVKIMAAGEELRKAMDAVKEHLEGTDALPVSNKPLPQGPGVLAPSLPKDPSKPNDPFGINGPAPAAGTPGAATPTTYQVKSGDSLRRIAKEQLGDESRWEELFAFNEDTLTDPNKIKVGQALKLPPADYKLDDAERARVDGLEKKKPGTGTGGTGGTPAGGTVDVFGPRPGEEPYSKSQQLELIANQREAIADKKTELSTLLNKKEITQQQYNSAISKLNAAESTLKRAESLLNDNPPRLSESERLLAEAQISQNEADAAVGVHLGEGEKEPPVPEELKEVGKFFHELKEAAKDAGLSEASSETLAILERAFKAASYYEKGGVVNGYRGTIEAAKGAISSGKVGAAISEVLLKGMEKAGNPTSAGWASLKKIQGLVDKLDTVTKVAGIPHTAMSLWSEFRTMCGYAENGHKVNAMDRLHAAREVLEKSSELSKGLSFVLEGAKAVLQKVGANAVSKWTGKLATMLKKVPENIGKAIAEKLGPVIDKLSAIAGDKVAEKVALQLSEAAVEEVGALGAEAVTTSVAKQWAAKFASKALGLLKGGFGEVLGGPALWIAWEITKVEAEFCYDLAQQAFDALNNAGFRQVFGMLPSELKSKVNGYDVTKPWGVQGLLETVGRVFGKDRGTDQRWQVYTHRELAPLFASGIPNDQDITYFINQLPPDLQMLAASKLQDIVGAFVDQEVAYRASH